MLTWARTPWQGHLRCQSYCITARIQKSLPLPTKNLFIRRIRIYNRKMPEIYTFSIDLGSNVEKTIQATVALSAKWE